MSTTTSDLSTGSGICRTTLRPGRYITLFRIRMRCSRIRNWMRGLSSSLRMCHRSGAKGRRNSCVTDFGIRTARRSSRIGWRRIAIQKVSFAPLTVNLKLKNSGIQKPVLIDVVSGEISPLSFKGETLEGLPLRDSVMAVADASYFDWPVLPEAPSGLRYCRDGARDTSVGAAWRDIQVEQSDGGLGESQMGTE